MVSVSCACCRRGGDGDLGKDGDPEAYGDLVADRDMRADGHLAPDGNDVEAGGGLEADGDLEVDGDLEAARGSWWVRWKGVSGLLVVDAGADSGLEVGEERDR